MYDPALVRRAQPMREPYPRVARQAEQQVTPYAAIDMDNERSGFVRLVIVPRAAGPLLDPDASTAERPRDEIDDAVDELFGPDPGGSVGATDVVLVAAGAALVAWSLLSLHAALVTGLGVLLIVLGLTLPITMKNA